MTAGLFIVLFVSSLLILLPVVALAQKEDLKKIDNEITDKQQEIASINEKIAELDAKRANTAQEADTIAIALERLKVVLKKAELELQKTTTAVRRVRLDQKQTTQAVDDLSKEIAEKRSELTSLLRQLYFFEQESLVRMLFDSQSLSDVLLQRNIYQTLQEHAVGVVRTMREEEQKLAEQKQYLDQQENDLGQLQILLNAQTQDLAQKRVDQKEFLQQKKKEQAKYESLITEAQQAREEIKKQIFTLQSGSIHVSLKTANDMALFAGKATGVRPALIMAVLKIESGVGTNLGSGSFPHSIALTKNQDAFVRITKKLGIDPYKAPLSRSGAMGPAQIMPGTWEGMEPRIQQLMGKQQVSPYELADAFVATGVFLADKGGTSSAKEAEALQRYVGGKYWESQSWYSEKVLAVAKEYEQQGL